MLKTFIDQINNTYNKLRGMKLFIWAHDWITCPRSKQPATCRHMCVQSSKFQEHFFMHVAFIFSGPIYEGESNENRKTEIKIRNIAPLSYKLADMLPML
jgi:hypothetical protein